MWASVVVAHGLRCYGSQAPEHRLSSCGVRAQLLHDMWDLPGTGIKPVSPALAGGPLPLSHQGSQNSDVLRAVHLNTVWLHIRITWS